MKISQVKIKNFRGYKNETVININDLTVFVGKNDVGKSTILAALDIFLNEGKPDQDDINKFTEDQNIIISVVFDDLPDEVVIDSQNKTNLETQYLLNSDKKLEVIKVFPNTGSGKVFLKAYHPTNPKCAKLFSKKLDDLKGIIEKQNINCKDKTRNAEIRKAIWENYKDDLMLKDVLIEIAKVDEKNTWDKLKEYMPLYALFEADRKNSDGDDEIQNPMKIAVEEILMKKEIQTKLKEVSEQVTTYLQTVASKTREKLKDMDPEIADKLKAEIPLYEKLKWDSVFKNVTILGDGDIPINKRGSGFKRLVLINFFRAEAERRQELERSPKDEELPDIIYAIEEPETSQHQGYQRKLIDAFVGLSKTRKTQIILTTHSPAIVKMLEFDNLKLVKEEGDNKEVIKVEKKSLPYPSLNEVNFLAFGESDETYHNELYGFIETGDGLFEQFENGKDKINYKRYNQRGTISEYNITINEYIRHQIHHPENELNQRYTHEQLQASIKEMRDFITGNNAT